MRLIRILDIVHSWMGWCPQGNTVHSTPIPSALMLRMTYPDQPGRKPSGSWWVDSGARIALESIRILYKNKWLLWFSLLTGLVLVFSFVTNLFLLQISGTNPILSKFGPGFLSNLIFTGSPLWFALIFLIGLVNSFFSCYLLAGLIVCVSYILSSRMITLREGLVEIRNYLRPLASWALIEAFAGTFLTFIIIGSSGKLHLIILITALSFIFFTLMLFVTPAIVLSNESLINAIIESVLTFRKIWAEIIICFGIFFFLTIVILLIPLFFLIFIMSVINNTLLIWTSVTVYLLVILSILFIGSTITGIATLGLYADARIDPLQQNFSFCKKYEMSK
jgi:hypothetical protein